MDKITNTNILSFIFLPLCFVLLLHGVYTTDLTESLQRRVTQCL
jgi:hypothetical protein